MINMSRPYQELATYYDDMFSVWGKDYGREALALQSFIEGHMLMPCHTLLDLGCGTGEHMRYLRQFYEVSGLDDSAEMLNIARQKLPSARFFHSDMADFKIDVQFDAIVSLFGAVAYVKTTGALRNVIGHISSHLVQGGIVIIEPWFTPDEFLIHQADALFGQRNDFKACRMRQGIMFEGGCTSFGHIMIWQDGQVKYFTSEHHFGLFTRADYVGAFEENGLECHFDENGVTERGYYWAIKP